MESECSRCHRKFQSSTEEMTICPSCLREEFSQAPRAQEKEADAIKQENELSYRRASARAERLSDGFQTGTALTPHGTVRLVLGVVIFLICAIMFFVDAEMEEELGRTLLPAAAQRPVSLLLCWAAAFMVFKSSCPYKLLTYPVIVFFVAAGWLMPTFWNALSAHAKKSVATTIAASHSELEKDAEAEAKAEASSLRQLTEEDLAIYREKRQLEGNVISYGIFLDVRDVDLRQSVRDALKRLLQSEVCVPYTRGKGTLFVMARSVGGTRNITPLMERFGKLTYSSPDEGIYEVSFSGEKVHASNPYSSEVRSTPTDPAFVQANLIELQNILDPARVRMAAGLLSSANVQESRREVHDALLEVLRDPWASEPGTYQALVEALAVYSLPGDKEAVDVCRKYFLDSRLTHRPPSPEVMDLLIREVPSEMVSPIVELWCSNPAEWGSVLAQLGTMSQDHLLDVLEEAENPQLISSILKHLEHHGTPEAAPMVRRFIDYHDAAISRAARATLRALEVLEH